MVKLSAGRAGRPAAVAHAADAGEANRGYLPGELVARLYSEPLNRLLRRALRVNACAVPR